MISAITLGLRGLQFIFATVVVGLAATLIKDQVLGSSPTTTRYSTFTGGLGIIVAAVGAASLFITAIPELIVMGVDAVCGLLFLAGGIAWAVGLKGISCTDEANFDDLLENGLINMGKLDTENGPIYGVLKGSNNAQDAWNKVSGNCKKGLTDEIFQFLCFALALGLLVVGYIRMRKGGVGKSGGYV